MTLQIKEGRYYRTRDGRKVGPMRLADCTRENRHRHFPWVAPNDWAYKHDGIFSVNGSGSTDDLIAEWSDDPNTFTLSDGTIVDLTAITTPFGLLDAETQGALKAHGGPYEYFSSLSGGAWKGTKPATGYIVSYVYRVKPTPKVETVTETRCCARSTGGVGWSIVSAIGLGVQGTLTTTLQDGKPVRAVWEADQ